MLQRICKSLCPPVQGGSSLVGASGRDAPESRAGWHGGLAEFSPVSAWPTADGFYSKVRVCRACSKTNRDSRSLLVFLRGQTTISKAFLRFVIFKTTTVNTMPDNTHPQPTLNIELPEDVAEGIYSNLAIISHSNAEFVVDFIRLMPNVPKARVKSRIILTPQHAKRLLYALKDNIHKYEMQFGKIEEPEHPQLPPMNFNTPPAQA